jgi:hypothetical protein
MEGIVLQIRNPPRSVLEMVARLVARGGGHVQLATFEVGMAWVVL